MNEAPPKVFISYSHDGPEHKERVLDLADWLREDGIDAEVDQYVPSPLEGWPAWCDQKIEAADFVLLVCTETYHRRVKGGEAPGKGLGVVWEARIIRQLVYDSGAVSEKFIPVLFSDGSDEHIPLPVKSWTRYVPDTEDGYDALYRRLTKQPWVTPPPVRSRRRLPSRPPRRRPGPDAPAQTVPVGTSPDGRPIGSLASSATVQGGEPPVGAIRINDERIAQHYCSEYADIRFSISNLTDRQQKVPSLVLRILERRESDTVRLKKAGAMLQEFRLSARIEEREVLDMQEILEPKTHDAFRLKLEAAEGMRFTCALAAVFEDLATGERAEVVSAPFEVEYPIRNVEALRRRKVR